MSKIQYIGVAEEHKPFRIINRDRLNKELSLLPNGKYRIIVEKLRKNKSNSQLGYLFACIYPIVLKGLNDAGWEFVSLEEVDIMLKDKFAGKDILNRNTGEIVTIPALKREMTTTEMMSYVESIREWCSEYLNTYIPEPGENFKMQL